MSDLTDFRDHARAQSTSAHKVECARGERWTKHAKLGMPRKFSCPHTKPHDAHEYLDAFGIRWDCPGLCPGCQIDLDRIKWARLADEVDAYLAGNEDAETPLW